MGTGLFELRGEITFGTYRQCSRWHIAWCSMNEHLHLTHVDNEELFRETASESERSSWRYAIM
jgi:hypothetical protein